MENTKKAEQLEMNEKVEAFFQYFTNDEVIARRPLRTCSAEVLETEDCYLLKSYNTLVAIIAKRTHQMADGLRYVYGYTATSAQHIAKFAKDYGAKEVWTWKEVK